MDDKNKWFVNFMISNNDFICTNYVKFIRNTTYNKFKFYFLLSSFQNIVSLREA